MESKKVEMFLALAGQRLGTPIAEASEDLKCLGAQLLLSETLEYVIKGLKVGLKVEGQEITDPNGLEYFVKDKQADSLEMLDGLADVAYTMYWNMLAFGINLEQGFDKVCDNNLEKFVLLTAWADSARILDKTEWSCGLNVEWPVEVESVEVIAVGSEFYAVGKDATGKVRKPSTYASVDLTDLV